MVQLQALIWVLPAGEVLKSGHDSQKPDAEVMRP